jgi:hypothetical protein
MAIFNCGEEICLAIFAVRMVAMKKRGEKANYEISVITPN